MVMVMIVEFYSLAGWLGLLYTQISLSLVILAQTLASASHKPSVAPTMVILAVVLWTSASELL
jgi:hypothetical protein